MSNLRPDQLPESTGLLAGDILIAETNPSLSSRKVVKISKEDLLKDIEIGDTGNFITNSETGNFITNFQTGNFATKSEINNFAEVSNFCFFSDVQNNIGQSSNVFYNTPTQNIYISGTEVDTAQDLKVYLRWDGPGNSYIGSGSINGIQIPDNQISELGIATRRFEGYIDNLNLVGQTSISGEANGFSSIINLVELGGGPTPLSVTIDSISNGTPKLNTLLGVSEMKGDDQINIHALFETSDVTGIKVYDSGISDGIGYTQYSLTDTGDGNYTATIPITITNSRSGYYGISIVAKNNFGTAGSDSLSANSISLNQTYPSISASDPVSYSGRSDGLRENESTTFSNSISDWDSQQGDTVLYSGLNSEIVISNSGTYEAQKTVSYANGIFSDSDNISIKAVKISNGSVEDENVKVRIANGPVIQAVLLNAQATSPTSPNVIGSSEVKGGDILDCYVYVDGNGVAIENIDLSLSDSGVSDGSQTSYTEYTDRQVITQPQSPYFGSFQYKVSISVTADSSRDGVQGAEFTARNNYNTVSDPVSGGSITVNNTDSPSVSISSITYPSNQEALKDQESATVLNSASNYDTIEYTSPGTNPELTISSPSTFNGSKSVSRSAGSYNITTDNFFITAIKTSNGSAAQDSTIVKIANTNLELSILNLSSTLSSSSEGISDQFNLNSTQKFLEAPDLLTDLSQTSPSELTTGSQGTDTNSNSYTITVKDSDTKGDFTWQASGQNLAGKIQNTISTNPDYTISGFSSRISTSNPSTQLGRGLFPIGTNVSSPDNVVFENIAEGGSGPNGGTIYSYQSYSDGTQLSNYLDLNNKFAVCNSQAIAYSTGDHIYNLDKTIRDANNSVSTPATAAIEE